MAKGPQTLPGRSDRPQSHPPPPPRPAAPYTETMQKQRRKKRPAPPPPVPLKRKIFFTDHDIPGDADAVQAALKSLQAEMEKLESLGREAEKQLLFVIEQSPLDWDRHCKADSWVELVAKKCDLLRRESTLTHTWLEMYLNDLHAETEYQLRCLIEKPESEKTDDDISREAKLLESLLDIIGQKNRLIDALDNDIDRQSSPAKDAKPGEGSALAADQAKTKKKKLKIRIKKLKKKLAGGSTGGNEGSEKK